MQAWDRYAYTNNNPLHYTDPSGHCGVGFILGLFGVSFSCPTDGNDLIEGFNPVSDDIGLEINVPVEDANNIEGFDPVPENDWIEGFDPVPENGQLKIIAENDEFLENTGTLPPETAHEIQSIVDDVGEDLYVVGGYARGDTPPRKDIDYGAYAGSAYEKYLELFAYGNLPEAQHPPFPFSDSFPPGNNNGSPYIQFRPHQNPIRVSGR